MRLPLLIVFIVLLLDQTLKIWVKTNMYIGEEFNVIGDWFIIHFVENPGMAFGLELGGAYGKIGLSLFRVFAVIGLCYYMWTLVREKAPKGVIISFALITAGALGNIIDSAFYGILFNKGTIYSAEIGSWMRYHGISEMNFEGYANPFWGCVVDMLYFPVIEGNFPDWVPFWGGDFFLFFRPVFNIADAAISVGVGMLILFYRNFYTEEKNKNTEDKTNSGIVAEESIVSE
ncbi:MAG: lipoprotein signal peptidase [Flavobacteriales bacterium]|nr:lipoprotein signal peptidase [Flavobacteriales bacterium]